MANAQLESQIDQARSAGYNDNQIKSYLGQKGFNLSGTRYEGGVGGFLSRNASTIGSVALPAIADIATGGLAIPADVALSAAGAGAGKLASNATEGENLTSGVGGATASGAFGGLLGGVGGKVIGKLASGTGKALDKAATKAATNDTEKEAVASTAPYTAVDKGTRNNLNMNSVIGNAKTLNMATDPASLHTIHDVTTGANGVVSGAFRQILGNVGKVDTSGVMDAAQSALSHEQGNLGDPLVKGSAANGTLSDVRNILGDHLSQPGTDIGSAMTSAGKAQVATISNKSDANSVFDAIQGLEGKIRSSPHTDAGIARANVFKAVKGNLEDSLYNGAGVDKAVQGFKLAPEDETAIRGIVSAKGGSDTLASHLIDGVNNAASGKELRALQKPAVDAGELADEADKAAGGALPKASAVATHTGEHGLLGGSPSGTYYATQMALHAAHNPVEAIPLVAHKASQVLSNVAGKLGSAVKGESGLASGALEKAGNTLGARTPVSNILRNVTGQGVVQGTEGAQQNAQAGAVANNPLAAAEEVATAPTSPATPTTPQFSQSDLLAAITADPANASTYEALYTALSKPPATDLTNNQQNDVVANQKATDTLNAYMQQLQSASGATGPVGGEISKLFGNFLGGSHSSAKALADQNIDVATTIASTLSPSGKPTASITKQIAGGLPLVTDSAKTAQAKYEDLIQRIQAGEFSATTPVSTLSSGE